MRLLTIALTAGMAVPCSSAFAQSLPAEATAKSAAAKPGPYDIEMSVAPDWSSTTPFDYREVTEATSVKVAFSATQQLLTGLSANVTLTPAARLDSDLDDPGRGSSFDIGGKLSASASRGFSLFGTVGYKAGFKDFFGESDGHENRLGTGIEFKNGVEPWCYLDPKGTQCEFKASVTYNLINSSKALKDQQYFEGKMRFTQPIWSWVKIDMGGAYARRWFDDVDPLYGTSQRVSEWAVDAGLDFSPLVNDKLRLENKWVRRLAVGFKYFESQSNQVADVSRATPSITLTIGQNF